jgi:hypothetical protein
MPLPNPLLLALALAAPCLAQDWTNAGGNAGRNGRTDAYGPLAATVAWSGSRTSIIAWQPVIAGDRVFMVRQTGFPPGGEPNGSPVVCQDLRTGAELWAAHVPFNTGDWTTWVAGVSDGKVYASRAGNGASVKAKMYALDQATGATVWISQDLIDAGAYDGVVFAPNGDPIVGSFRDVWRIRASDGTTVWRASRLGSVSGTCGACVFGDAVYVADAAAGGNVIKRFSLTTGAFQYQSPVMAGFTIQNTPLVGPDGTVYLSRTQNNASVDHFYAFADSGSALTQKWRVAAEWTTTSEFAIGKAGQVYMVQPGKILSALDPATGATLATYATPLSDVNIRVAVDGDGRLFVANGGFPTGRVYSFDPDLTLRWSIPVANVNIGAPAVGHDGTLIVAGVGTNVQALRTASPWTDVGGGVAGINGASVLAARGTLTGGNDFALSLRNARPATPTALIIGFSAIHLSFFGGTLVPFPDLAVSSAIDGAGEHRLTLRWPAATPPGTGIWFQHWYADAAAILGLAASNGLRGVSQ